MKKLLVLLTFVCSLYVPAIAHAEALDILIAEVQTETVASASEESIVLVNNAAKAIDLSGWRVQYFSAGAADFSTPTRNIALGGTLIPHDTFLIASSGYRSGEAAASFGATLAAAGGHIRLVSGSGATEVQHDLFGWGTAAHPEGTAVPAASKGQKYTRKTNQYGTYLDTDNNDADFDNGTAAADTGTPPEQSTDAPSVTPGGALEITELLPDPASPATDAESEFIELFNASSESVTLAGLKLQTGSSYSYSYTFKEGTIAPGAYAVFYAPLTKLTLSNSGGQARLVDTDGAVISETASYGKAIAGSSWTLYESEWQWSGSPTPGAVNAAPTEPTAAAKAAASGTPKAAGTKSTSAKAKSSSSKSTSSKAPKAAATSTSKEYKDPESDKQVLPVSPLLLAVVGVPLVGYMLYEYRHDLGNFFSKTRRHRGSGSEPRPVPQGR